jgi:hypothetical protein
VNGLLKPSNHKKPVTVILNIIKNKNLKIHCIATTRIDYVVRDLPELVRGGGGRREEKCRCTP